MDPNLAQQIFEQIKKANKILVILPASLSADMLASGLAMRLFLERLQKDVGVVSAGHLPENLSFLPRATEIKNSFDGGKSLVISVDTSLKKVEEVSYQSVQDKLHIYLKSKSGEFDPKDVSFTVEKFPVDLLICLGGKSLEDFGALYEQHADVFFETPKINIDHSSNNEYFGQLNLVDLTATSIAEILSELFQKYEEQLVDEDTATCLLAGIIAQTNSFQHIHTTPKAFLKASELVSLGGRQQEIVKNIFKTKSLPLLKLWGRALARLKTESETLAYSLLTFSDFEKAGATKDDLLPVLKEFVQNTGGYKIIGVIAETAKASVKLIAAVHEQVDINKFLGSLNNGSRILDIKLGHYRIVETQEKSSSLEELEQQLLKAAK